MASPASCRVNINTSMKMFGCCSDKRYCSNFVVNAVLERATRPRAETLIHPSPNALSAPRPRQPAPAQGEPTRVEDKWKKYFKIRYKKRGNSSSISYRGRTQAESSGNNAFTATCIEQEKVSLTLSETCGLSISELEAMAARQARQLETQDQLLAAKAQRLRFLKSGGEAERLQRLREKVASQEERLRKLRALRGKVQSNRNANSVLSSDLESLRAVFNEKEKELSLAVAKVDELTRQLEDLRRSNKDQPPNGQQSAAAAELEKLRRELMYRQKLREAQATRVAAQRAALNQRQEETMRVDRRIAELQERLHRKRLLNQQLAATLKHQENADDFVSVPNKNDPKYQTLPYNAKLFAPFASKHEEDQFEKSMQQMQIISVDHHPSHQVHHNNQHNQLLQQQQQQQPVQNFHQQSNGTGSYQSHHYNANSNGTSDQSGNSASLQGGESNGGSHLSSSAATINSLQQLHHLLSISGFNGGKSGPSQTSYGGGNGTGSGSGQGNHNGLQTVHSTQTSNASRGKAVPMGSGQGSNNGPCKDSGPMATAFPVVRPSNFYPTGAPPSSSTTSGSVSSTTSSMATNQSGSAGQMAPLMGSSRHNGLINSQNSNCGSNGNSLEISLTGTNSASLSSTGSNDTGFVSSGSSSSTPGLQRHQQQQQNLLQQHLKPALPPKPAKPTPPPRQAHDLFNYNMRSNSVDTALQERSDIPVKSKSLFVKSSSLQPSGSESGSAPSSDKESSNNSTVRVSINRRIEMPPAFLFPESDPPPSDLVPEHGQISSGSGLLANPPYSGVDRHSTETNAAPPQQQQQQQHSHHQQQFIQGSSDSVDASPLLMPKPGSHHNQNQQQLLPEEYTLPDLFPPHPVPSQGGYSPQGNNKQDHFMNVNNQINSHHMHRNAQALIESLGQHSQSAQLKQQSKSRDPVDDPNRNTETNANTGNVSDNFKQSSGESGDQSQANFQLESIEAVNDDESESCGNNINNNIGSGSGGSGSGLDGGKDSSPSEEQTLTANKTEGAANPPGSNPPVPGVLRRVKKSNFKSNNKDHLPLGRRVSFDPLALLLDASLEGELDLVVKTAGEVGNVSAANDEGITALHNAICAGHFDVVRFLVQFGCDVNAQDSDGWTPLHCAASCNNVSMVKFLVEHGACIFATTLSDHETAAEKCEEDEDGFGPCSEYLYSIQEKLGIMNGGIVYAVFEYDAQNSDELSFKEGDRLVILRKGDEYEREWWWASLDEKEGYVPRNLLGLYPRVVPQKRSDS